MSAISLQRFGYRYPGAARPALTDVDLEIEAGEFVVLAGRSGSGKSTVLRAACGLVPHFHGGDASGSARILGLDLRTHGPAELGEHVGMVAQEPESQVVSATVRAEVELPLEIRGESQATRGRAVEEVALALGIEDLLNRSTTTLSGGEVQRVALAAALVGRPRLILLDEPASALDPVAGDELFGLLRRLNEEWGTTVVLAEHRLERCLGAADRVCSLAGGRITFDGTPEDFLSSTLALDPPLAPPLARMFGEAGLRPLPASVRRARKQLSARGVDVSRLERRSCPPIGGTERRSRGGAGEGALEMRKVWVELDAGSGSRDVLRGISLRLDPSERVALMGRNGAGKTTLLRCVAGLQAAARGKVSVPRGAALVPQSPARVIVRDRVGDELPGPEGLAALQAVGLEGAVDADPRDLSGGERQRLALALGMAGRTGGDLPGVVCLDEPTRGMDGARKDDLRAWIGEITTAGAAVVVATHDVEFAARFADRVVLLGPGEILADGSPQEVLAGGWYFATEVARTLDGRAVTAAEGAALLRGTRNLSGRDI